MSESFLLKRKNRAHYSEPEVWNSLCPKCAAEAIEAEADGVIVKICEKCGALYDPFTIDSELSHRFPHISDIDVPGLCIECATEEIEDSLL